MSHPQVCSFYEMAEPQDGKQKHVGLLRLSLLLAPRQFCPHSSDQRMSHGLAQRQGVAIYTLPL